MKVTEYLLKEHLTSGASGVRSATLTTRGGAFRDLGNLDAAEQCARKAIECARKAIDQNRASYHSYNLLGAIYWQRGKAEEGEEYFAYAESVGAPLQDQVRQKKSALNEAGPQQRRAVAKYLLEKDPTKYWWAKRFLR